MVAPEGANTMEGGISRRQVLVLGMDAAGLAALAAVLAACGTSPATLSPEPPINGSTSSATPEPLGVIEDTRVVFYKTELSVINDSGVLLNLVATDGGTGIRFYKDFGFGNEQERDHPWSIWIEGKPKNYEGLAIIRDWAFTAALWDADGKLTVGSLDPHPPSNPPADARLHVRGTIDEVEARVDGMINQNADILQVTSASGLDTDHPATPRLTVRGDGDTVLGSSRAPTALVIHDTVTGQPYAVTIANGRLVAAPHT
jgi:hypothetical protein